MKTSERQFDRPSELHQCCKHSAIGKGFTEYSPWVYQYLVLFEAVMTVPTEIVFAG